MTPSDISCETPRAVPESPGPAPNLSYDPVPLGRSRSREESFQSIDHEDHVIGTPVKQNLATPPINPLSTVTDSTPTNGVEISILRVVISYPSQSSRSRDFAIGATRDPSESALNIYVAFGGGNSLRKIYEYTISPRLLSTKYAMVKHVTKYIRRSYFMFRLRHGPYLLSHDLFVSESKDQIAALANKLALGERTDCTALTEQTPPTGNISKTPRLLPVNDESTRSSPYQGKSCQAKNSQYKMTVRDHKVCCGGKCNAIPEKRKIWFCVGLMHLLQVTQDADALQCRCRHEYFDHSLVVNCLSCQHVQCCECEISFWQIP